jgi:diguanylate cyclase (GGDEF)-like protein/PAS domain S-box-containing protein
MLSFNIAFGSRWKHISIAATILITLTAIGGVVIGANAIRVFSDMRMTWQQYDNVSEQKVSYLTKIHVYLGYSGMTQHLKDYLLHGDEHLLTWIDIDLDQAKNSIDSYHLLDISADETKALEDLRTLVLKTRKQVLEIPKLRAQGLTPAKIDKRINLNPDAAISALNQLHWAWRQQAETTKQVMEQASENGSMMVKLGWIFLPIMATIAFIVFWLVSRLCRQVAAYEEEKKALEVSERKFRDMAANVPGVVFQWYEHANGERGYLYVSPRCQELYGVSPEELKRNWHALTLHPEDEKRYHSTIDDAFQRRAEWTFEGRFLTPDGKEKWGRCLSKPAPTNENEIIFNGVMIDISMQKKMEEDLRILATTDALTGANNRRHFLHMAEAEITRAGRYNIPLSILMVDLDHFKRVNDTYGHAGGDEVLRQFVEIAKNHLRSTDVLGRIGGEEFAILLPETANTGAITLAERIRQDLENTKIVWGEQTLHVTASLGVADLGEHDTTILDLLARADRALYTAKNNGRNCVVLDHNREDLPARAKPEPGPTDKLARTKPGAHGAN